MCTDAVDQSILLSFLVSSSLCKLMIMLMYNLISLIVSFSLFTLLLFIICYFYFYFFKSFILIIFIFIIHYEVHRNVSSVFTDLEHTASTTGKHASESRTTTTQLPQAATQAATQETAILHTSVSQSPGTVSSQTSVLQKTTQQFELTSQLEATTDLVENTTINKYDDMTVNKNKVSKVTVTPNASKKCIVEERTTASHSMQEESPAECFHDATVDSTDVGSILPDEQHMTIPDWYQNILHRKQQESSGENDMVVITTTPPDEVTTDSVVNASKKLLPLVMILCQSHPANISKGREWYKKPVEAKAAEAVGSLYALLIVAEIGLFIAMDVNVLRVHGRRAFWRVKRCMMSKEKIPNGKRSSRHTGRENIDCIVELELEKRE